MIVPTQSLKLQIYLHLAYTYAGSVLQSKRSKVTLNVVYVSFRNLWE